MPFLPKCSRSHSHFPTCLSSVLWSMYCLSSPQPGRWKSSGYSGNPFDCSLFRRLQLVQTSGFYKALFTTSDEGEVNTRDSHRLPWPVHDHGLCFHNHPVFLYQLRCHCSFFFFNYHFIFDVFKIYYVFSYISSLIDEGLMLVVAWQCDYIKLFSFH